MTDRWDSPDGRTHSVGDDCQPPHEPLVTEPWEGPLTAHDQAMIDAAWETHRAAGPKTLLDGFGEATDQVVALRAENAALKAGDTASNAAAAGDLGGAYLQVERLKAEIFDQRQDLERLRAEIGSLKEHQRYVGGEYADRVKENDRLRAELQACRAVIEAAREASACIEDEPLGEHNYGMGCLSKLRAMVRALDAVPRRAGTVVIGTLEEHLEHALDCLMEQHQHEEDPHGPRGTGLRAQAIAHVRYALLLVPRRAGPEEAS